IKSDVTKTGGKNERKVGADWEHISAINSNFNGGNGQRITKRLNTTTGQIFYAHRFYINDRASGYNRADPTTWQIAVPLTVEPDSHNVSLYAQDSVKLGAALTVNGGIRWEGQNVRNRDGETAFELKDNWAPRIGFVWDVAKNSRSKVYANWGRFYESIPMDINIRAFGGEIQCLCNNFSQDPANYLPDPGAPASRRLGGTTEPVDPELKGQYIDEVILGYDWEAAQNFAVG